LAHGEPYANGDTDALSNSDIDGHCYADGHSNETCSRHLSADHHAWLIRSAVEHP
jgi:hypothetical protein